MKFQIKKIRSEGEYIFIDITHDRCVLETISMNKKYLEGEKFIQEIKYILEERYGASIPETELKKYEGRVIDD